MTEKKFFLANILTNLQKKYHVMQKFLVMIYLSKTKTSQF